MNIRPSALAGRWYPESAATLGQLVDELLGVAPAVPYTDVLGVLAPHAGLRYSGGVAGCAFRQVLGRRYDVVVVVAPSHHPYPHPLLTSGHTAYQTPLGRVPLALDILQNLDAAPIQNDPEHAIEIELPFLQRALGAFELVPLAMLDQSLAAAQKLANALVGALVGRRVLFVASSDLSHFYDQATANQLDQAILEAVAAFDPAAVLRVEEEKRGFACGRGAIAAVMLATAQLGASAATIEAYATSGDVTGDFLRVVGYGAATFCAL